MRRILTVLTCLTAAALLVFAGCEKAPETVRIGFNIPMTGDIPKVGEGSKFAAEMFREKVNAAGGIAIGPKKYPLEPAPGG